MNKEIEPLEKAKINFESLAGLVEYVSAIYLNVAQEVIVTTEDKVLLWLSEHLKRMERRRSWITPLGIFITIVLTLATSSFKDILYLSADTWRAIFIIVGLISLALFIGFIIEALKSEKVEDIVAALKKSSPIKTKPYEQHEQGKNGVRQDKRSQTYS